MTDVGRHMTELAAQLRVELVERHRSAAVASGAGEPPSLERTLEEVVSERAAVLSRARREELFALVLRETVGLGPLEDLLADPHVEEVMVNGPDEVWVERGGRIQRAEAGFEGETHLRDVIERILGPLGRRVDELSPMADARLADGSRVNVVIPPLAVDGPALSIRRFGRVRPGPAELTAWGAIPADLMEQLERIVRSRRNVLVSGGTGSGKTTVLNALSSFIDDDERVITIEDSAELRLVQPHVVRLESRPPSVEGGGEVSIRDLVRNALRMRPDRIVIGEVRGAEAMDLIAALNTGHGGALCTVHANSPEDALRRVETLALMAGVGLPHDAVREQLTGAVDAILHLGRMADGTRQAQALCAVESAGGEVAVRALWQREPTGEGAA
jgi:pilus assembly protein CpaF